MRIGFCTPYARCESARVAARIADWAELRGHAVSIRPTNHAPANIGLRWDKSAVLARSLRFTDWAQSQDAIVWTHKPIFEQIAWAKSNNVFTVVYALWQELNPADKAAFKEAAVVLAPSLGAAKFVASKWNIHKTLAALWDSGLPLTIKDPRIKPNYCWVLLPLFDHEPYKTEMTAIEIAARLVNDYPDVVLTIAYNSSTMATYGQRRMRQIQRYFRDRVRLVKRVPLNRRPLLYRDHDLTLWPVHQENTGIVGIDSISMGTPVAAFHMPPLTEFLNQNNAVLAPCQGSYTQLGAPRAEPNYTIFERCVRTLIEDRRRLHELQQTVHEGLPRRRQLFQDVLTRLFG